jgi:hypothetical protein
VRWLQSKSTLREKRLRRAGRGLASSVTRRGGGLGGGLGMRWPVEVHAQIKSSAEDVLQEQDAASIAQAVERLVCVTEEFQRRLLLVVEDTDVFMPPEPIDEAEALRPRKFVDHVVNYLARDFPSTSLVAINSRYGALIPQGSVAIVKVPSLRADAIGSLIEHYARRSGLRISAAEVADSEALSYLAGRYAETNDIRRTLELLHKGVRKIVGEGRGERISTAVLHGL